MIDELDEDWTLETHIIEIKVTSTMLPTQWEIKLANGDCYYGRAEYQEIKFREDIKNAKYFYSVDLKEEQTWYPLNFMLEHFVKAMRIKQVYIMHAVD